MVNRQSLNPQCRTLVLWLAATGLLCVVCTISAQAGAALAQQPARYTGPTAGTLVWSGRVEKDTLVRIEGSRVSPGRLTGELPGVPVTIQPPDVFGVVEAPSAANGYKRLYLRSLKRIRSGVVIKWSVASAQ